MDRTFTVIKASGLSVGFRFVDPAKDKIFDFDTDAWSATPTTPYLDATEEALGGDSDQSRYSATLDDADLWAGVTEKSFLVQTFDTDTDEIIAPDITLAVAATATTTPPITFGLHSFYRCQAARGYLKVLKSLSADPVDGPTQSDLDIWENRVYLMICAALLPWYTLAQLLASPFVADLAHRLTGGQLNAYRTQREDLPDPDATSAAAKAEMELRQLCHQERPWLELYDASGNELARRVSSAPRVKNIA